MKKRLLFWSNIFLLHFSLAYYLQQKIDADFYAVIDTPNKPKKMFQNQNLVDFQKSWYFHDHIKRTTTKPDLKYLSNFEKKYQIDLWKIAINERHFYRFNRFYKFTSEEILKFLEQECKLFEQILDETKPDYFLTYDPPFHHQKLLLDMCKVKNIKVLCMYFTRVGGTSIIAEDGGTLDLPQNLDSVKIKEDEFSEKMGSKSYSVLTNDYKNKRGASISDKFNALLDYILFSDSKNTQTNFTYYGRNKLKVILDTLQISFQRKIGSKFLENNAYKEIDLNVPFTYFPLNIEEELSMLHYSPFFTNQIEVIRHIAKVIPIDQKLYVKEHPFAEFRGWHKIDEYKEIMEIPNVRLIHPSFSSKELIKNSRLVVTIRGTASFDAISEKKPSLVFGDVPFSIIPSVYKVNNLTELPDLINSALNTKINPDDLQKYLKLIKNKSINFDMMDFEVKRNNQFYSGNTLSDVEISEKDTKQFLEENKKYFESLVNAHLTKINES